MLADLIYVHNGGKETFGLHGLILCVSEVLILLLLCNYIVGMGSFDLHELILCESEGFFSE